MASGFPPRSSSTFSPAMRGSSPLTRASPRESDNNRLTSLALVPTSKDAASPYHQRSPLSSIGTNNNMMGVGVRQRRQPEASPFEASGNNHFWTSGPEKRKGPPRASLSMGMSGGSEASNTTMMMDASSNGSKPRIHTDSIGEKTLIDSSHYQQGGHWVLAFGFSTKQQHEEVLRKFRASGKVIDVKGTPIVSGSQNWVAFRFENDLAVEKASCEKLIQLRDGCLVGVQRLPQAEKFFRGQQQIYSTVTSEASSSTTMTLFPTIQNDDKAAPDPHGENDDEICNLDEDDILMHHNNSNSARDSPKKTGCCNWLFASIYGW